MDHLTIALKKNVVDLVTYEGEAGIRSIVKTVFETIMKLERNSFLGDSRTGDGNKANGYYRRFIRSINEYIQLQVPRDRLGLFRPIFLDAVQEQDRKVSDLALALYTHGCTTRNISSIFEQVYGTKLSPAKISNITHAFSHERLAWQTRPIEKTYYVLYVDALYVPIRRGDRVEREALYIAIGLRTDLQRDILGVYNLPMESAEGWKDILNDFKRRGMRNCLLVVADGLSGLETVVAEVFPRTKFQECIVHKKRNVLAQVRHQDKAAVASDLAQVFILDDKTYTADNGKQELEKFLDKWCKIYPSLRNKFIPSQLDHYFSYLAFPTGIQRMIYTTNWIERFMKEVRKIQRSRNSFPNPESALNLVGAFAMDYEQTTYRFPVTAFRPAQAALNLKLETVFGPLDTQ